MAHKVNSRSPGHRSDPRTNSRKKIEAFLKWGAAAFCAALMMVAAAGGKAAAAPQETVLYTLSDPYCDLTFEVSVLPSLLLDISGALYISQSVLCAHNDPLDVRSELRLLKLTPPTLPAAAWNATVINKEDYPEDAGIPPFTQLGVIDGSGAIYALHVEDLEGTYPESFYDLFRFTPPAWTQTSIWSEFSDRRYCFAGIHDVKGLAYDLPNGAIYVAEFVEEGPDCVFSGPVFKLTRPASGSGAWIKTKLFTFNGGSDGITINSLTLSGGRLYGTTSDGGATGNGTLFELTPAPGGGTPWIKTTLYSFTGGSDTTLGGSCIVISRYQPISSTCLTSGKNGELYGLSSSGGAYGKGRVVRFTPRSGGGTPWAETTLYSFKGGTDLAATALTLDSNGALYAPAAGGDYGKGRVIKLAPPPSGGIPWTLTMLYSFTGRGDGGDPSGALVADKSGNLYGTAPSGGATTCPDAGCGVVYKLAGTGFVTAIPFSLFSNKLVISGHWAYFQLLSNVTLGAGAAYLDPPDEPGTVQVGAYSATIPPGSFVKAGSGEWDFDGTVGGVNIHARIWLTGTKQYLVLMKAMTALTGTKNPVPVTLTLGPNTGTASVTAAIYP